MGVEWPFGSDPVCFTITVAFSARQADLDNAFKPLFDTYQNIFDGFNDNKVYIIEAKKTIVPKGEEYINVKIERMKNENEL